MPPAEFLRAACGALLEVAHEMQGAAWDSSQLDLWGELVRNLATTAETSDIRKDWCFPAVAVVQQGEGCYALVKLRSGAPVVKGAQVLAGLARDGSGVDRRSAGAEVPLPDAHSSDCPGVADLFSGVEDAMKKSEAFARRCGEEAERLFAQKTQPLVFLNQASVVLKVCLYKESDPLCVVPIGGVGGYGVVTIEPGRRVTIRPPTRRDTFKVKVFEPRLIDKSLYSVIMKRGQRAQLRSHDCEVEGP